MIVLAFEELFSLYYKPALEAERDVSKGCEKIIVLLSYPLIHSPYYYYYIYLLLKYI